MRNQTRRTTQKAPEHKPRSPFARPTKDAKARTGHKNPEVHVADTAEVMCEEPTYKGPGILVTIKTNKQKKGSKKSATICTVLPNGKHVELIAFNKIPTGTALSKLLHAYKNPAGDKVLPADAQLTHKGEYFFPDTK